MVLLAILGMGLLFLDFFSKAYVFHILPVYESLSGIRYTEIPVFQDLAGISFYITVAFNKGAAWGMLSDFQYVLLGFRIAVIFGMFVYLFFFKHNPLIDIPLVLVISGALGNVIDFFLYGVVVDFLHFNLWGYDFPIFNFADSCITVGVAWLLLVGIFSRKKKKAAQ